MKKTTADYEKTKQLLDEAEAALEKFLASPLADDVIAYLKIVLRVEPLVKETPEKTYFQLGILHAISELQNIQNQAKGKLL